MAVITRASPTCHLRDQAAKQTMERADRLMVLLRQRDKINELLKKQAETIEELQVRHARCVRYARCIRYARCVRCV